MLRLLYLSLLPFCSLHALDLTQYLKADTFYKPRLIQIKKPASVPASFDYVESEGFEKDVLQFDTKDEESASLALQQAKTLLPLELVQFCIQNDYRLEFHRGALEDSLYFLHRQGITSAHLLESQEKDGVHYLVLTREDQKQGMLILSNLRDSDRSLQLQSILMALNVDGLRFNPAKVQRVDFHPMFSKEFEKSWLKEEIFTLPEGCTEVWIDSSGNLFTNLMRRKFASMTLDTLRGLYGDQFLEPLKKSLIEEGFEWKETFKVSSYEPLEKATNEALLSLWNYSIFQDFEKELVEILKTRPEHPMCKVLLLGNELSISKEPLKKEEILRYLSLIDKNPLFAGLSLQILPLQVFGHQNRRVLVAKNVPSGLIEPFINVLNSLGVQRFLYLPRAISTKKIDPVVFTPFSVALSTASTALENRSRHLTEDKDNPNSLKGLHFFSPLQLSKKNLAQAAERFDFLDSGLHPFLKSCQSRDIDCASLGRMTDKSASVAFSPKSTTLARLLSELRQFKAGTPDVDQMLLERLISLQSITDIALQNQNRKFLSLEDKILNWTELHKLNQEEHGFYLNSLRQTLNEALSDPEHLGKYLRSAEILPADLSKEKNYLAKPYTNTEVLKHLDQFSIVIEELKTYLKLLGETKASLTVYGDFVEKKISPFSPLVITLKDISQSTLLELLKTPFGNAERKFLLRILPQDHYLLLAEASLELPSVSGINFREMYMARLNEPEILPNPQILNAKKWWVSCEIFRKMGRESFLERKTKSFRYSVPLPEEKGANFVFGGVTQLSDEGKEILNQLESLAKSEPQSKALELAPVIERQKTVLKSLEEFGSVYSKY